MTTKSIRRNLYKVLRKTGVPRDLIVEDAELKDELLMDDIDMTCFLYYLETNFSVDLKNEEIAQLNSVKSTIDYLQRHCA
ncbi:MAG: acyl carrier protein [Marinilabiliaceae bacterium]|nr:acyl carrier protein [Marinilabiliaceae bacterium]